MTAKHTLASVRRQINQIVARKGKDYRYQKPPKEWMCVYRHDGQPSCIVGYLFDELGIPIEDDHNRLPVSRLIEAYLPEDQEFTESAQAWLEELQLHQDRGEPWGEAVREANASLR